MAKSKPSAKEIGSIIANVSPELFDVGFGLARQKSGDRVEVGLVYLDVFCAGTISAGYMTVSRAEFDERCRAEVADLGPVNDISPACARKLVEGAVAYGRQNGFASHPDLKKAMRPLGGVRTTGCLNEFTFGQNGMPHYREAPAAAHRQAVGDRDREAADLRLSESVDRLDALRDHLNAYGTALAALWPTLENWRRARAHAEEACTRLDQATRDLHEQQDRQRAAEQDAAAARQHYLILEESSGKEVREILAKLQETEQAERTLDEQSKANEKKRIEAATTLARAEETLKNLEEALAHCVEEREKAVHAFQRFISERLLADAHPQLATAETDLSSVSRAVELARRADQVLSGVNADDETWNHQQQAIHRQIEMLRDNLVPQGHSPDTRQMDDLLIIRVPFRGNDCSVSELHAAFSGEIEDRGRLLDEKERAVIENHLLSETATEIQRLLREAEEWVRETNKELESRPTSTGMRLRFSWEPDPEGPPGLQAARDQLRQRAELWSEEQRLGLAQFFQQQIEAERIENPSASWPDLLFNALDFIMTSEREWGCYPTLPALSICQLSTRPGFDAIAVTRWAWNGRERKRL